MTHRADLWVFGYGSLMWRPGFPFLERRRARVTGLHRGFYVYSLHHRGLPERPGLVLGLDQCGVCDGIAYRVAGDAARSTIAYLREREQVTGVYREEYRAIHLAHEPAPVRALLYVVERRHAQYAGVLDLARQARIIRGARGHSGANLDYLFSTVLHMREEGIHDPGLERLLVLAGTHLVNGAANGKESPFARAHAAAARRVPSPAPHIPADRRTRFLFRRNLDIEA